MKKGQHEPPDTNRPSLGGTEGFDALFEHARRDGFSAEETDRLWQNIVSAGPGAGDAGPEIPSGPARIWSSVALKAGAVLAVVGGLLAVGVATRRSASHEPVLTPSTAVQTSRGVAAPSGDEGPPVVSWEDLPRSQGATRAVTPAVKSRPVAPPPAGTTEVPVAPEMPASPVESAPAPAVASEAPVAGPSEGALLLKARRALSSDPSAALALTDDAAARFPEGPLAPEREVLAIEALAALGRMPAARARLVAFRARYPQSPHLAHLDTLVSP
jgi:hypothetical protein